jgi:hypothetical protein
LLTIGPIRRSKRLLSQGRRRDGIFSARERDEKRVSLMIDLVAAMLFESSA